METMEENIRIWVRVREKSILKSGFRGVLFPSLPIKPFNGWVLGFPRLHETLRSSFLKRIISQWYTGHKWLWVSKTAVKNNAIVYGLSNWNQTGLPFSEIRKTVGEKAEVHLRWIEMCIIQAFWVPAMAGVQGRDPSLRWT